MKPTSLPDTALSPCPTGERRFEPARKHGDAVRAALAFAHDDLVAGEVEILDAQAKALEEPQLRAVEQRPHDPCRAGQRAEQAFHCGAREHDRQAPRAAGPHDIVEPAGIATQHIAVEEQQSRQRLILRRRADLPLDGERGEKTTDVGDRQIDGVPLISTGCRL